jgi:hypothetical protein
VGDWLLLASIGGSKEGPRSAASQPLTRPLVRDSGSLDLCGAAFVLGYRGVVAGVGPDASSGPNPVACRP